MREVATESRVLSLLSQGGEEENQHLRFANGRVILALVDLLLAITNEWDYKFKREVAGQVDDILREMRGYTDSISLKDQAEIIRSLLAD